jgi:YbbR domain-containing protein
MASAAGALLHNWRLKLSALGLAIFLWGLVQTEPRNSETVSSIPILVEVSDTAWTLAGPPTPAVAELRLGGPAREIVRLARAGTTLRVPLEAVGSADTLISLSRQWVDLPEGTGLTVVSVSPANIRVSLERAITVTLPLALSVLGEVPSHLALASPLEVSPDSVRVRGPASRLAGLGSIPLVPFDLRSVELSGIFNLQIDTTGLMGSIVFPVTTVLEVRVEDQVERTLSGLRVRVDREGVETDVVIDPVAVNVQLTGARTLVSRLDADLVRIWVQADQLRGMVEGEERQVQVHLEGVPELVVAVLEPDFVIVRRATDQAVGGLGGGGR